jgi:hypothetical protein
VIVDACDATLAAADVVSAPPRRRAAGRQYEPFPSPTFDVDAGPNLTVIVGEAEDVLTADESFR